MRPCWEMGYDSIPVQKCGQLRTKTQYILAIPVQKNSIIVRQ